MHCLLKQNYHFSSTEIQAQLDLFKFAEQKLDFILFLSSMIRKCEGKAKPKGYLINAIKKELQQKGIKMKVHQKTVEEGVLEVEQNKQKDEIDKMISSINKI